MDRTQRGSVIIFSLMMLIVIVTVTITLLDIFLPKIRSIQEAVNSTLAIYAADTATELCLYEARQQPAVPVVRITSPATPPGTATVLTNGTVFNIASLSASPVDMTNDCRSMGGASGNNAFKFRATGTMRGVSRSLEVSQ